MTSEFTLKCCECPTSYVVGNPKPCRDEYNLPVDHNHKTGLVRGILCQRCNRALGSIGDTVSAAKRVVAYLRGT